MFKMNHSDVTNIKQTAFIDQLGLPYIQIHEMFYTKKFSPQHKLLF